MASRGIDGQIDENLRQLRGIGPDRDRPVRHQDLELDLLGEHGTDLVRRLLHELLDGDRPRRDLRRAAETENVRGDRFAAFDRGVMMSVKWRRVGSLCARRRIASTIG
ncbi:MAG TPA: hypothetical protein VJ276_08390 [Thermoanaerobaculia bacterium]|nr:hypothetical protein [Thermoanaerobaculia bacterium]